MIIHLEEILVKIAIMIMTVATTDSYKVNDNIDMFDNMNDKKIDSLYDKV
jgi:hypothetical protein